MNKITPIEPELGFIAEIEQEVLGVLLAGGPYPLAATILESKHFVFDAHAIIFEACENAHDNYGSCSLAVVSKLVDKEELDKLLHMTGKKSTIYMAGMVSNVLRGKAELVDSCKRVVTQWARIKLSGEFNTFSVAANEKTTDITKLVAHVGETLDEVMSDVRRGATRKTRHTLSQAIDNALTSSQEAKERGSGLTGVTWGLADVNHATGGIQKRDLTLLAARPSIGKTTAIISCALRMAKKGHGVGVISLEMDADKIGVRAISDLAYDEGGRVPYIDLLRGQVSDDDSEQLRHCADKLSQLPMLIEDQAGLRMNDIRVKLESMMLEMDKRGVPLDTFIIDHIGLIKPSGRYSGNRVQEVTEISAGLKSMAREYNIALVALSQLSRGVESRDDKRPMLSDLRDSGSIEQDADCVVFLYRDSYYLERAKESGDRETERLEKLADCHNKMEFIIAKNRNGPTKTIDLFCDMAFAAVRNGVR